MKKQITKTKSCKIVEITISTDGSSTGPYFSINGRLLEIQSHGRFTETISGCIHDEILKVAPELKPFVDLHLSDLDGVPMYAVGNGFYWLCKIAGIPQQYGPDQSPEECRKILQEHLRIGYAETLFLLDQVAVAYIDGKDELFFKEITPENRTKQEEQGVFRAKTLFNKEVDSMKERWKSEAESALKLLESL
jgi:hypothetical protein